MKFEISTNLLWKLSIHSTDVFLQHKSVPDLLLHLPRLPGVPTEHEQARGEPVQPVDGPEVLQIVFLGKNEDHRVVPVSATRMYLPSTILRWIMEFIKIKLTGREHGLSKTTSSSDK